MAWWWVFIGGGIGASARYAIGRAAQHMAIDQVWATLLINLMGSLLLGLLIGAVLTRLELTEHWRLFMQTGILGGFTTYATFSLDIVQLSQRHLSLAVIYASLSLIGGVILLLIGLKLGRGW